MNGYMQPRNGASADLVSCLLVVVRDDLMVAQNIAGKDQAAWDRWNNLHSSMTTYYDGNGKGVNALQWEIKWEWNTNSVKRDEVVEKRQACSRPANPSSDNQPTATGSHIFESSTGSTTAGTKSSILPSKPSATIPWPTASSPAFTCITNP